MAAMPQAEGGCMGLAPGPLPGTPAPFAPVLSGLLPSSRWRAGATAAGRPSGPWGSAVRERVQLSRRPGQARREARAALLPSGSRPHTRGASALQLCCQLQGRVQMAAPGCRRMRLCPLTGRSPWAGVARQEKNHSHTVTDSDQLPVCHYLPLPIESSTCESE